MPYLITFYRLSEKALILVDLSFMDNDNEPKYTIPDVLKGTDYALTIFDEQEKSAIKLFDRKGKPYLRDFVDEKERPAKPEEIVRQLFLFR